MHIVSKGKSNFQNILWYKIQMFLIRYTSMKLSLTVSSGINNNYSTNVFRVSFKLRYKILENLGKLTF